MNDAEARDLLARQMQEFRAEPYDRLVRRMAGGELVRDVQGASGAEYQVEISVDWDDAPDGNVRVIGSIDDGGWRAFVPLTASFIKAPDGTFVGEPADPGIAIARASLLGADAEQLIARLNAELTGTYPEPGATHFALDPAEVAPGRGAFLIARAGDRAVGCGAVRLLDSSTAELKRMYVDPEWRGRGIGRALVAALETEARALGASRVVLETGVRQEAAMALYARCGFTPVPLYGEYCLSPETSVCLGKTLGR